LERENNPWRLAVFSTAALRLNFQLGHLYFPSVVLERLITDSHVNSQENHYECKIIACRVLGIGGVTRLFRAGFRPGTQTASTSATANERRQTAHAGAEGAQIFTLVQPGKVAGAIARRFVVGGIRDKPSGFRTADRPFGDESAGN